MKEKKTDSFFAVLNSLSYTKTDMFQTGEITEQIYNAYMTNKWLSFEPDTILFAQEMNLRHQMPKRMQYDYYLYSIRKRKRFFKYKKKPHREENIKIIAEYFGYSNKEADRVLTIFTQEEIEKMKQRIEKGGQLKSKSQ